MWRCSLPLILRRAYLPLRHIGTEYKRMPNLDIRVTRKHSNHFKLFPARSRADPNVTKHHGVDLHLLFLNRCTETTSASSRPRTGSAPPEYFSLFITLKPRVGWGDTKVYEPSIRTILGTTSQFCEVGVLQSPASHFTPRVLHPKPLNPKP